MCHVHETHYGNTLVAPAYREKRLMLGSTGKKYKGVHFTAGQMFDLGAESGCIIQHNTGPPHFSDQRHTHR